MVDRYARSSIYPLPHPSILLLLVLSLRALSVLVVLVLFCVEVTASWVVDLDGDNAIVVLDVLDRSW